MLGLGAFGRKPRKFNYKPIHYNPAEEARNERKRRILGENFEGKSTDGYTPGQFIKDGGMRRFRNNDTNSGRKYNTTMLRLIFVLGFLILATFFVLKYLAPYFAEVLTKSLH